MHFDKPLYLFLIPLLVIAICFYTKFSNVTFSKTKLALSIFLRSLIVTLLLLFLATPSTSVLPVDGNAALFLVDVSESISEVSKEKTLQAVDNIMKASSGKVQNGLVLFAGNAILAEPLSEKSTISPNTFQSVLYRHTQTYLKRGLEAGLFEYENNLESLQEFEKELSVTSTDISKAIKFAKSILPRDSEGKIYVVTDGYYSGEDLTGDIVSGVNFIRANDTQSPEILVKKVTAPISVKYGEPFDLKVEVTSNYETGFSLNVAIDNVVKPVYTGNFRVGKGRDGVFVIPNIFKQQSLEKGVHTLKVFLNADGDTEKRNNSAVAVTYVISPFKTVIFGSVLSRDKGLQQMLNAQDIDCEIMLPANIYNTDLSKVDCVILDGLEGQDNDYAFVDTLNKFISEGGGLLVVCNDDIKSTDFANLEKLLPVEFLGKTENDKKPEQKPKPPPKKPEPRRVESPPITLLFVIDKSGSMAGRNISLAKEACIAAANALSDSDYVGVVAFDALPYTILNVTPASQKKYIESQIMRLYADGGTELYGALALSLEKLRAVATPIKHMIVLSDGLVPPADFEGVVKQLKDNGITVTTVCVGSEDFDANTLSRISSLGNGRFLFTSDFNKVPQIFVNETKYIIKGKTSGKTDEDDLPKSKNSAGGLTRELKSLEESFKSAGAISIRVKDYCEVLNGIDKDKLPNVEKLLLSNPKPNSILPLVAKDDKPVLAIWQGGLGRSAVWTSDLLRGWQQVHKLFAQLIRYLSSKPNDLAFTDRISFEQTGNKVDIFYKDYENVALEMDIVSPDTRKLDLAKISPDTYKASFPIDGVSTIYEVLVKSRSQSREYMSILGCGLEYEPELSTIGNNEQFFAQVAKDGKLKTFDEVYNDIQSTHEVKNKTVNLSYVFLIAALLILPFDVFLHRKV